MSEIDYENTDFTDEEIRMKARRYAAKQFDAVLRGDRYTRHDINNAAKIFAVLMRANEAELDAQAGPQEIGLAIEKYKQREKLKLAE